MKAIAQNIGMVIGCACVIIFGAGSLIGAICLLSVALDWLKDFGADHGTTAAIGIMLLTGATLFGCGYFISLAGQRS